MMLTTDLALRFDPIYGPIARRFHENPDQLADAFAKAWYKLLHRDMGPIVALPRPVGAAEPQLWQDPVPAVDHDAPRRRRRRRAQGEGPRLGPLGGRSSSPPRGRRPPTFRGTDKRGGANGARVRLAPQKDWAVNDPAAAGHGAADPRGDPAGLQRAGRRQAVSLADLIVLARIAPRSRRRRRTAGHDVTVPFSPGRTDATQEQTDVESFEVLEPTADGFRNYVAGRRQAAARARAARAGQPAHADRAGDDGARRRPAGAERQRTAAPSSVCSPTGPGR